MRSRPRKNGEPSKMERCALVAAKSGKLFQNRSGLRLLEAGRKSLPVRMFGPAVIKACIKSGWLQAMDQGDGDYRIMTTLAGDAVLAKPMRFVLPNAFPSSQREALR